MLSWTTGLFRRRSDATAESTGPKEMTIAQFEQLPDDAVCYWDPCDPEQRLASLSVHPWYMEEWRAVQKARPSTAHSAAFDINEAPDPKDSVVPGEIPDAPEGGIDVAPPEAEGAEERPEGAQVDVPADGNVSTPPATPSTSVASAPTPASPKPQVDAALVALCDEDRELVRRLREVLSWPPSPNQQRCYAEDALLLRFLRARDRNVAAAEKMIRDTRVWRLEHKVDLLNKVKDPHEHVWGALGPNCFHGYDYQGRPVYYERTGQVRLRLYGNYGLDEPKIVWRHVHHIEYLAARCQHSAALHQRNIESIVSVQDLSGLPYVVEPAAYRVFRDMTRIDQANYPERLHKMILINAPLRFRSIWFIIRPWLPERTRSKVEILGTNYLPRLMELIPPSQIPSSLGGKCHCKKANGDSCIRPWRSSVPNVDWMNDPMQWDWPPTGGLDKLATYGPSDEDTAAA